MHDGRAGARASSAIPARADPPDERADSHAYTTSGRERAREEECVEPYKNDPTLGLASLKPPASH